MKMKNKILGILIILISFPLFAKENILIKSDVAADLEGYDFVSNFEITSDSGRFKNSDLMILAPNEKGFRFLAKNVPEFSTSNYKIIPAYGFAEYSEYSLIFLKEVSIIYDELFTAEQLEQKAVLKEDFGIDELAEEKIKAINKVKEKIRLRENEASLMDKASEIE